MATIEALDLPTVEELEKRHMTVNDQLRVSRRLRAVIACGGVPGFELPSPGALIGREAALAKERAKLARLIRILRD